MGWIFGFAGGESLEIMKTRSLLGSYKVVRGKVVDVKGEYSSNEKGNMGN